MLILFPAFCTACKNLLEKRNALCVECKDLIKPVASITLRVTQKYYMQVYAVGDYQEPLRQLILAKSYQDILACYYMAQLIFESFGANIQADYLVPVPLHWTRYAKRGYNQSLEIASHLSRWTGIPVINIVKRVKRTAFQSHYDTQGRYQNVCDAFILQISDKQVKDLMYKQLILIDDVMTTGATLRVVAKTLLRIKPIGLRALVLARTR